MLARTISSAARSNTTTSARIEALGRADLGVGVVDVVAGAVGQHRVDEVRLDVGRQRVVEAEPAGVVAGMLVLEVPTDATDRDLVCTLR